MIPYFTQPALGYKYNGSQNPAEFMIDVSNGQIFPNDLKICRLPEELETLYKKTKYYIPPANTGGYGTQITADLNTPYTSAYATTLFTHFKMLLKRSWISTIRDTNDMKAQVAKNVLGTYIHTYIHQYFSRTRINRLNFLLFDYSWRLSSNYLRWAGSDIHSVLHEWRSEFRGGQHLLVAFLLDDILLDGEYASNSLFVSQSAYL